MPVELSETRRGNMYYWAFLRGPKAEIGEHVPGTRYHVRNSPQVGGEGGRWEVGDVRNTNTLPVLARVLIAKFEDDQRLFNLLYNVPVNNLDPE
ncbi:uncharacterized protein L3040_007034 [Drepanopeziza brunnea f. sp. 'multigermtubi']|uniref:Uncharacterized protein n=1 Tax=Marssonina brunnea f. sp. multigermtubi (strain MB_m1) TaxID=1072389 RepID=K1WVZ6_MARBU|nr:uncharacterized protein MBM_09107 [Drepanopeziza brunnea f. sp. 'multigermtubi' MB_m1]EKD12878.1 hypothetical protein MBM_09107 [Drepanopeziza brunnea f. sp. 'multigermtubi' MB_m1]KAJ5038166.1 hypothetical protein L3040_007034 [Drepanopeziza brunnea f. sp. 'multigermtubi']